LKMEPQKGRRRRSNGEGSIYQRSSDNRWVGSAYVYTATGQRKRRPVYGASFDEVRQKLDKIKGDSASGVLVPDRSTSLRDYLEYWLREIASHKRATTLRGYERFLAVSSGFGDQVCVVPAWRVDEGVMVSLAA
jgi:hypothetical protein